jgi:hypothetical protein
MTRGTVGRPGAWSRGRAGRRRGGDWSGALRFRFPLAVISRPRVETRDSRGCVLGPSSGRPRPV